MKKVFNKVSVRKVVCQLLESLCWITFGSIVLFVFVIPAYYKQRDPEILYGIYITFILILFYIIPVFFFVCTIRYYLFERKIIIIIDESIEQIQYITPTHTSILYLQNVISWKQYYNGRMSSLELNILTFNDGKVVKFSNILSFHKYLTKKQVEFCLPQIEVVGTIFRFYQYP